jgi:hypothetical protein
MMEAKPEHVPLHPGLQLISDINSEQVDLHQYYKIINNIIFFTTTCLNLSFVVNLVSKYMSILQYAHLEVVQYILRYIKKTTWQSGLSMHPSIRHVRPIRLMSIR